MDVTVESTARLIVVAACLIQLSAAVAVLIRERLVSRPAPVERVGGPVSLVNYIGIAGFVFVGLAIAVTDSGGIGSIGRPVADGFRAAGILVLGCAGLLSIWGVRSMGRHLVAPAEVRPDTELVTAGAFGFVRHPLYASVLLLWAGAALALLSIAMGAGFAVLIPAFYLRARAEETLLSRHFGNAWAAYAARVPMLLPRLHGR